MDASASESTVYITGMGLVSPFGIGVDVAFRSMLDGACGIRQIERFPVDDLPAQMGGILDAETEEELWSRHGEDTDLAIAMILEAAAEALGESPADPDLALVLASNFGVMETLYWCWRERVETGTMDPESFAVADGVVEDVAAKIGVGGLQAQVAMSCASGAAAAHLARSWLVSGRAERVLVVGYDTLSEFCWTGLANLRTMAPDVIRPFDRERQGTIFSEGAAAMLFSVRDADRGSALAELAGSAVNNNAYHMTAPPKGAAGSRAVMAAALADAGMGPDDVRLVSAHATGTAANDVTESEAISDLIGAGPESALVAAFKSSFGHLMGAAGLAEMIISVRAMGEGVVPPVINLRDQDPACTVNVVGSSPATGEFPTALTNSAGIGGNNGATVLRLVPSGSDAIAETGAGDTSVSVLAAGWVLPGAVGSGAAVPGDLEPDALMADNGELDGFSAAPYLESVKGYLDPSAAYALGAASLCLGHGPARSDRDRARVGVVTATRYGAPQSALTFIRQMSEKGPRLASPMIFPHGYDNTPGNLVSIEFGFAGPHMVFSRAAGVREALWFAVDCLRRDTADEMLVIAFEAVSAEAVPDGYTVLNGALCWRIGLGGDGISLPDPPQSPVALGVVYGALKG